MKRACSQSWSEIYHGFMPSEIYGRHLPLFNDCDTLDYCEGCRSRAERIGPLESWQRCGTDPVELLGIAEHVQLELPYQKLMRPWTLRNTMPFRNI